MAQTRRNRRAWLLVGLLISQLIGGCHLHPRPDYQVGLTRIGDRLAVYAPTCPGETITAVQVLQRPDVGKSGDFVLIWEAADPITADTQAGLIVLGDGFGTVRQAPPAQFEGVLGVTVETTLGDSYSAALQVPDHVAGFPVGTPVTGLSFETNDGQVSYDGLRAHFDNEFTHCD